MGFSGNRRSWTDVSTSRPGVGTSICCSHEESRMKHRIVAAACVVFLPFSQYAQKATPANRFEGEAQFKDKNGKSKGAHVTIRQWSIPGKQKVDALPERGFLLVTVR